jgi:nucleotide-binding universal stress UspA family protein
MPELTHRQPIIVGIDGSQEAVAAAEFAWEEAQRSGAPLLLLHAYPAYVQRSPMLPMFGYQLMHETGSRLLQEASSHLLERFGPEVELSAKLVQARPKRALLRAAEAARLVVLGRRHLQVLGRALVGSTAIAVAARAACPVVIVPSSRPQPGNSPPVVVGVDGTAHSAEAVTYAFSRASARGGQLIAVHAWTADDYYSAKPDMEGAIAAWRRNADLALAESLAGWQGLFPDVTVQRVVDHRRPLETLLEYANEADLLVVGTRSRGRPSRYSLGSVTRHLMSEATCPVAVVQRSRMHREHDVPLGAGESPEGSDFVSPIY